MISQSIPTPHFNDESFGIHSNTELPENFKYVNSIDILYPAYVSMRYNGIANWQKYFFDKYGLELNVIYPEQGIDEYLKTNGNCVIYLNHTDYFDYEYNNQLFVYSNDRLSHDLSPYYVKYGWDKLVPPEYIEDMKVDNKIYAVPVSNPKFIYPRHYNSDYLDELNIEIPSTVDTFYEFLKRVRTLKRENSDFYPMCIDSQYITPSTSDIFRAFGVYVNSEFNSMVSYNPMTNSFEDAAFSENMELALDFIKNLQQEDLLFIAGESQYSLNGIHRNIYDGLCFDLNKEFATEYHHVYVREKGVFLREGAFKCSFDNMNGYYLSGINTDKVCEVRNNIALYLFPKTITNIYGTVDLFNDIFSNSNILQT